MGRARVSLTKTSTVQRQPPPSFVVCLSFREMRDYPGSDSRTGFLRAVLTSIQCLDDDDDDDYDIAFSLWRVLLRKCINTLWYGWFTFFLLFSPFTCDFFKYIFLSILYRDIRGRRNGAVVSSIFTWVSYVHLQRSWVSVAASQR